MPNQAANKEHETRMQRLQQLMNSGALQQSGQLLNSLRPGEISHLLEALPIAERSVVWSLVNEENDGEVLMELADDVRADLISRMEHDEVIAVSEGLDTDDLADLIQELPHYITSRILDSLDTQNRQRVEAILVYPEDTAGGLMNPDTITIRPEVTLDAVIRYLRLLKDEVPPHTDSLVVVNREEHYLGILSMTDLVTNDPTDIVAEVMSLDNKPIPVSWGDNEVANRFEQHDLLSAPVVDDSGKLLGRITVDDVVDLIREEGEHAFMGQAGLSEDEDMFAPVLVSTRRRALWLGVNLITAFLASWVIGQFEATIEKIVALAVLMPIVASMGGIAGSQTLTLTIRGIALGQLSGKNARQLLLKEMAVGAFNGLIWAVVVAVIAGLWFDSRDIALLIAAAMAINLLFAASTGAILPLMLERMGIDPALAGGVLLTTVTDIVGFLAFLGLATIFLL